MAQLHYNSFPKLILTALVSIFFFSVGPLKAALIDLEATSQDFVLESKRIEIPGYPDAFNPCLFKWNNKVFLMSFRIRDPETKSVNQIGLIWLDNELNPMGMPQVLDRSGEPDRAYALTQDPRLVAVGNKIFVVYNNMETLVDGIHQRMAIAELHFDGIRFYTEHVTKLLNFENANPKRKEKNWVPFDYQGRLLLAYSINPHRIMTPCFANDTCQTLFNSQATIKWDYGDLRGGTPAILDDDKYLAFFHSVKELKTTHSEGKLMTHYYMGAYTFTSQPPFTIQKVSPKPIVGKNFYNGPAYKTWKPLRVVFSVGLVIDEKFVWVSYGRQDHECWIVKIDKEGLYNSLVPASNTLILDMENDVGN